MESIELNREIEQAENDIIKIGVITNIEKTKFINEITNGLGNRIKDEPNKFVIKKPSIFKRIANGIKHFFIKF